MRYLSTSITTSGVSYAHTLTGIGFSYLLSAADDLWLNAHLPAAQLRPFMRQHRIGDLSEFDFTHLLLMPGHKVVVGGWDTPLI